MLKKFPLTLVKLVRNVVQLIPVPIRVSVTQGAKILGVARHTLSRVINGQAGISPEMAIRLEKAGWSNADHWLRLQTAFDLAQARRNEGAIKVKRYCPKEMSMR